MNGVGVKVVRKDYSKERINHIKGTLHDRLERVGILVEAEAKENVSQHDPNHPQVDTGRLRGSITSEVGRDFVKIGSNVHYGKYLEFGHKQRVGRFVPKLGRRLIRDYSPAYPWLFPALQAMRDEIKRIMGEGIR